MYSLAQALTPPFSKKRSCGARSRIRGVKVVQCAPCTRRRVLRRPGNPAWSAAGGSGGSLPAFRPCVGRGPVPLTLAAWLGAHLIARLAEGAPSRLHVSQLRETHPGQTRRLLAGTGRAYREASGGAGRSGVPATEAAG